jgi:hypothetical protein
MVTPSQLLNPGASPSPAHLAISGWEGTASEVAEKLSALGVLKGHGFLAVP